MSRLSEETSPYLRQHAGNPVDWYPWGEEALAAARREDKPLFVSIGYASCHWCHVMAHESFEDPETARALAADFISVKVDREERPDVDTVYMAAVQALTGSGGWPMSVFCLPDGRPFYGGTYFPPQDRHGLPAFRRVVAAMADAYRTRRAEVEEQADAIVEAVTREVRLDAGLAPPAGSAGGAPGTQPEGAGPTLDEVLNGAVESLAGGFDRHWGGFGPAPKFPRPGLVHLCLWQARRRPGGAEEGVAAPPAREMAATTLRGMAAGGMYDHLAGGFCRYATDGRWLVPHFEKMLTDQALLARCYLHAWQETGDADALQVVHETLDFAIDELGAPGGAFFSSLDADAGGVEGGHAIFTVAQARQAFSDAGRPELADAVLAWYGITEEGNWEGTNVLCRPLNGPLVRPPDIEEGRRILLAARSRRPQPARDDKVLTEWSAMTAAALAEAAAVLGHDRWALRAQAALEFLFAELRRPDGRWLRSWQDGRAQHLAFAGDYGWIVEACTRVAELTGAAKWMERASSVAADLLATFWDSEGTGVFTTGHDAPPLVVRPKDLVDGAIPSPNSVAALALLRVGALTGQDRFTEAGRAIVDLSAPLLRRHAQAVADLVPAFAMATGEGAEVVVAGERPDLLAVVRRQWHPALVVAWGERTGSPLWEDRAEGRAYLCRGYRCLTPAADPGTLADQLASWERAAP